MKGFAKLAVASALVVLSACSSGTTDLRSETSLDRAVSPPALAESPTDAPSYRAGLAALEAEDYAEAGRQFFITSQAFPESAAPFNGMAIAEAGLGQRDVARELFARALQLEPENVTAREGLARLTPANSAPTDPAPASPSPTDGTSAVAAAAVDGAGNGAADDVQTTLEDDTAGDDAGGESRPVRRMYNIGPRIEISLKRSMYLSGFAASYAARPLPVGIIEPEQGPVRAAETPDESAAAVPASKAASSSATSSGEAGRLGAAGATAAGLVDAEAGSTSERRQSAELVLLNGNGRIGQAGATANRLRRSGLSVSRSGSADNFDYERTVILYPPERRADADRLMAALGTDAQLRPRDDDLDEITAILGADIVGGVRTAGNEAAGGLPGSDGGLERFEDASGEARAVRGSQVNNGLPRQLMPREAASR